MTDQIIETKIMIRKLFKRNIRSKKQNNIKLNENNSSVKDSIDKYSKLEDGECCLPCIGVPCCPII